MSLTRELWNTKIPVPFPLWLLANIALWAWVILVATNVYWWLT